jgi:hypothetical protein
VVGNAVRPRRFEDLLDEPARIRDIGARRSGPQRTERVGGRADRVAQRVLGLAEIDGGRHRQGVE